MTTTVRNIMMSFTLAGSLLLVASPAMAQGRRPVSTGSSTMATSRSSESRQSVDRSSSSASMQSRSSATRQSVDRSSSATRQSVERPTSTMSSRSNESRVERPTTTMQSRSSNTSVSSSSTSSRVNESRPSSTMNNNRPRPNTGTGTSSNGNGSRDLGNVQSATSNYTVPGYSNPRPGTNGNNGNTGNSGNHGNGGNYGNGGNNGNHNGNGGNNGNHYGNGGNNGNHNGNGGNYGNNNGRRPGTNGHSDNYRPDPNRGHNAYRDHYSWNHAHNDWSRPLPPPARVHRPAPYYYHRPVIPAHWRPYHGAPVIDRILGITFGTSFNVSLSFLYTNGYNIDGYDNGVVYLRNVHMMSLTWPDVMLCYDDYGRLMNAQFIHSSYYNDRSRYNRLYHDLCAAYGTPIEIDGGGITWFGGNRVGYVTLSMTTVGSRYYTNLYVGN